MLSKLIKIYKIRAAAKGKMDNGGYLFGLPGKQEAPATATARAPLLAEGLGRDVSAPDGGGPGAPHFQAVTLAREQPSASGVSQFGRATTPG